MFGGIPSLLHIHNVDVKDRPELHLPWTDGIFAIIPEKLEKELVTTMKTRQKERHAVRIWVHPSGDVVRLRWRFFWVLCETLQRNKTGD